MSDLQKTAFLHLDPESEIGNGACRRCFLHPRNPNLLIKLEKKKNCNFNMYEAKYYKKIVKKHGEVPGIIRVHGFVETNLGRGLIVEAIRNADGSLSRRIADISENPDEVSHWQPEKVYEAVKTLIERVIAMDLRIFDFNMGNIVLMDDEKGTLTAFIIDLKSFYNNREYIPFSSWFSFFARRKMKRRAAKLLRRLHGFISKP